MSCHVDRRSNPLTDEIDALHMRLRRYQEDVGRIKILQQNSRGLILQYQADKNLFQLYIRKMRAKNVELTKKYFFAVWVLGAFGALLAARHIDAYASKCANILRVVSALSIPISHLVLQRKILKIYDETDLSIPSSMGL